MGNIKINWANASPTLGAALLSAALIGGSPDVQEHYDKGISSAGDWWKFLGASHASFQDLTVSHGTTPATSLTLGSALIETDPWQELESLDADWDGNGAAPVSRDAIEHALSFLESLPLVGQVFEPFAHPNGSVGLEAHNADKAAYLIVSPMNRFAYVLRMGETVHRGNDVDASVMRRVLELLY